MADILKSIIEVLPKNISKALFEGANIVLYTSDREFFLTGMGKIREAVDKKFKTIFG